MVVRYLRSLKAYMTTPFWVAWMAFWAGVSIVQESWILFIIELSLTILILVTLTSRNYVYPYSWQCKACDFKVQSDAWVVREEKRINHLYVFHSNEKRDS